MKALISYGIFSSWKIIIGPKLPFKNISKSTQFSIDEKSESKFNDWYRSGSWSGTHPWEIYRGGNSTHINLAIAPFQNGWKILLDAFSTTRMAETCRIALALDRAHLPFTLLHKESYAKRLQGEDWVGIVPKYHGIAYAWQEFPSEFGVSDCIHLDWIFEENPKKRRHLRSQLKHLIFWLPEKITAFVYK